jgi:hypothetical protein
MLPSKLIKNWSITMKQSIISLLTLSTVALFSFPALADNANVQKSEQISTQIGNHNTTVQDSLQYNENRSGGRSFAPGYTCQALIPECGYHSGSSQTSYQDAFSEGNFNQTGQYNSQENINRHGLRRGR